jgi:hypothetical protein
MSDTKLADLTALTVPSGDDLLYVVDDPAGTPSDKKLALDNLFTRGTVTVSSPVIDAAQTWNASGTIFTALKLNVINTASLTGSLLMDLQLNGSSQFSVSRFGTLTTGGSYNILTDVSVLSSGVFLKSSSQFSWASSTNASGTQDTFLTRRGAANLRFGAADAAGSSIAISSVDTTAETITLNSVHGLTSGAAVLFITTGSLPGGISANTVYYARVINTTTFEIYDTFANATASSGTTGRINLTSAGSNSSCQRSGPFQTLSVQSFTGENIPGQPFVVAGSQGTGAARGGDIVFQTAPAGTTGSTANSFRTVLTLSAPTGGGGQIAPTITVGGDGSVGSLFLFDNHLMLGSGSMAIPAPTTPDAGIVKVAAAGGWGFSSVAGAANNSDLVLRRDTADTLALRRSTNPQETRVYGSYTSATNFQRMSIKTLRESSGALSGATYVTTIAIPAYANLIGVTTRVTTAVTGATTYDVGDGSDVDLWGTAIGVTLGSQSQTSDFTAVAAVGAAATSRTVTLTANGSNFTGGVIEICLHYLTTEAD